MFLVIGRLQNRCADEILFFLLVFWGQSFFICQPVKYMMHVYWYAKLLERPMWHFETFHSAKYGGCKIIKSYKIHFVVQYASDYCPLEQDNYNTTSAHLGSAHCNRYISNLHGACIFLDSRICGYWKQTQIPIHKLWFLREASQFGQRFIMWKGCLNTAWQNCNRSSNSGRKWPSFDSKKNTW